MQSMGPPTNDNLVELLLLLDACRREMPARITAVLPYLGYARKDRRTAPGEAVGLRVVADLLNPERVDRIVVVDPHVAQVESIFSVPVERVSAVSVIAEYLQDHVSADTTVLAPDIGAMKLAQTYADLLGLASVTVALKERRDGRRVEVGGLVGDGMYGPALLVDDMITTGSTIEAAAAAITEHWKPSSLIVAATHGLLVDDAVERIERYSPSLVAVTNTVAPGDLPPSYRVSSVAGLLADVIARLHQEG
jgi:ribose-phosphate pyrophosphokinase